MWFSRFRGSTSLLRFRGKVNAFTPLPFSKRFRSGWGAHPIERQHCVSGSEPLNMFRRSRGPAPPWVRKHGSQHHGAPEQVCRQIIAETACGREPRKRPLEAEHSAEPSTYDESFERAREAAQTMRRSCNTTSVHKVLRQDWPYAHHRPNGPGPLQNLKLLEQDAASGGNPTEALERVIRGRLGCVVAPSTADTYDAHVRLVLRYCKLVRAMPLPASRTTVVRFVALFNNASTLRGALAAWRQLHIRDHQVWPLEGDPFFSMLHRATKNLMAPKVPRHAMRRALVLKCVALGHQKGGNWRDISAAIALAYMYGLRVPSELLRQCCAKLWTRNRDTIDYGPIRRK